MSPAHIAIGIFIAAIWGLNFVVIKFSYHTFTPLTFILLRFILTTFPIVFFLPKPKTHWKQLVGTAVFMWMGQFLPMCFAIYKGLSPGLCSLMMQSQVVISIIISVIFYHARLTMISIAGVIVSCAGLIWISCLSQQNGNFIGYILVMISAFSVSIGNFMMKTDNDENLLSFISWSSMISILPMFIITLSIEGIDQIWNQINNINLLSGSAILYTSYISSIIGFSLWAFLMRHYTPLHVVPFIFLVPVFSMICCALLLDEQFTTYDLMAGGLVIIGLVINYLGKIRPKITTPSSSAAVTFNDAA